MLEGRLGWCNIFFMFVIDIDQSFSEFQEEKGIIVKFIFNDLLERDFIYILSYIIVIKYYLVFF